MCDAGHRFLFGRGASCCCQPLQVPIQKAVADPKKEEIMGIVPSPLAILLMAWGAVTAVLIVAVIYGNTLDIHEDEEFYINKKEEEFMGGPQKVLVAKMERLKK